MDLSRLELLVLDKVLWLKSLILLLNCRESKLLILIARSSRSQIPRESRLILLELWELALSLE